MQQQKGTQKDTLKPPCYRALSRKGHTKRERQNMGDIMNIKRMSKART